MASNKVELYIYDLSKGMAAIMSPILIGKTIYSVAILRGGYDGRIVESKWNFLVILSLCFR